MEKDTEIILSAVLILLFAMASLSFFDINLITGKASVVDDTKQSQPMIIIEVFKLNPTTQTIASTIISTGAQPCLLQNNEMTCTLNFVTQENVIGKIQASLIDVNNGWRIDNLDLFEIKSPGQLSPSGVSTIIKARKDQCERNSFCSFTARLLSSVSIQDTYKYKIEVHASKITTPQILTHIDMNAGAGTQIMFTSCIIKSLDDICTMSEVSLIQRAILKVSSSSSRYGIKEVEIKQGSILIKTEPCTINPCEIRNLPIGRYTLVAKIKELTSTPQVNPIPASQPNPVPVVAAPIAQPSAVTNPTLTILKIGDGKVSSVLPTTNGIICGADCTENYNKNTQVTLVAVPLLGGLFAGWSGACSGISTSCTVTMDSSKTVTAMFISSTQSRLTIFQSGTGTGTISTSSSGINCGNNCFVYNRGASVTLTPTPSSNSIFLGWSNCNSINGNLCTIVLDSIAKSANPTFDLNPTLSPIQQIPYYTITKLLSDQIVKIENGMIFQIKTISPHPPTFYYGYIKFNVYDVDGSVIILNFQLINGGCSNNIKSKIDPSKDIRVCINEIKTEYPTLQNPLNYAKVTLSKSS